MLDFAGGSHFSVYQQRFDVSYWGCAPPPINEKKYTKNINQNR